VQVRWVGLGEETVNHVHSGIPTTLPNQIRSCAARLRAPLSDCAGGFLVLPITYLQNALTIFDAIYGCTITTRMWFNARLHVFGLQKQNLDRFPQSCNFKD